MSKVYSFRLNDDNPREAQAREVIEAWVAEGYSLRHVIVEAINALASKNKSDININKIFDYFEGILSNPENVNIKQKNENFELPDTFKNSIKATMKSGLCKKN